MALNISNNITKHIFYSFSGLLSVGDIIKEVNGIPVFTPQQLMDIIRGPEKGIQLKIIQAMSEHHNSSQVSRAIDKRVNIISKYNNCI